MHTAKGTIVSRSWPPLSWTLTTLSSSYCDAVMRNCYCCRYCCFLALKIARHQRHILSIQTFNKLTTWDADYSLPHSYNKVECRTIFHALYIYISCVMFSQSHQPTSLFQDVISCFRYLFLAESTSFLRSTFFFTPPLCQNKPTNLSCQLGGIRAC